MKKYKYFNGLHLFNGNVENKSKFQPIFGHKVMSKYFFLGAIYTKFILLKNYAFSINVTNSYNWSKEPML